MTKIFLACCNNTNSSGTNYLGVGSGTYATINGTESVVQQTWRTPGTFTKLYTNVNTNSASASSSMTLRKNTAAGNNTVSIGAGATGDFKDTTHSDTFSAADLIAYQVTQGGTGSLTYGRIGVIFEATTTSNTVNRCQNGTTTTLSSASTTYYMPWQGGIILDTTGETASQYKTKTSATVKNMNVVVSSNGRLSATSFLSRKNTANGNLSISVGAGATGQFEDTSNSDSLVYNDLTNFSVIDGLNVGNLVLERVACDFVTTNNQAYYSYGVGTTNGNTVGTSTTTYFGLGGIAFNGTETVRQFLTQSIFDASSLAINVGSNGITATSTVRLRKNAASTNQVLSIGSGVTGYLEDISHTDPITSTDNINFQIVTGGTGTTIEIAQTSILANFGANSEVWSPINPDRICIINTKKGTEDFLFVHGTPGYTGNPRLEEYQPLLSPQPQKPPTPRGDYAFTASYGLRKDGWTPKLSEQPQREKIHYPETILTQTYGLAKSGWYPHLSPQPQPIKTQQGIRDFIQTLGYGLAKAGWYPEISPLPQKIILNSSISMIAFTNIEIIPPYVFIGRFF